MFTTFARTDTHVAVKFENEPVYWITKDAYRTMGVDVTEFVPEVLTTQFVTGETVPVRAKAAKCHGFAGGWNGFEFYVDSKGVMYATVRPHREYHISWERMMSE